MDKVLNQFLTMTLLKDFDWPLEFTYSEAAQRNLVEKVFKHPVCVRYPPSRSYRTHFLKILIGKVEGDGEEVIDSVYELYASLVATPQKGDEDRVCYKSYHLGGSEYISLKESTQLVSNGTTGLITWPAALHFVDWSLENRHLFEGRHILELGSGVGLAGIAICRGCGPASYCFTDCHEEVLERLRENIEINIPQGQPGGPRTQVLQLNWSSIGEGLSLGCSDVDCIVATDVVYDTAIVDALLITVMHLFRLYPHAICYIASCVRNQDTYVYFTMKLAEMLIVSEPQTPPAHRGLSSGMCKNQNIALVLLAPARLSV